MRLIDNDDIWGEPSDRPHALKVLRRAVALGINFIDTAESYGPQTDEILIAAALQPHPEGVLIATKGGLARPRASRWDADCRRENLRRGLAGTVKRLPVDRIDLYQRHTADPKLPLQVPVGTPPGTQGD